MKILHSLRSLLIIVFLVSIATIRHCEAKENFKNYPKSLANINYDSKECVILKNPENLGFGAVFFSLLKLLDDFDKIKFAGLEVIFDNGCYLDKDLGPNWWEYLFEPLSLGKTGAKKNVLNRLDSLKSIRLGYRLSKLRVSELVQKYILLRPEIQDEIDLYVNDHFDGYYVIGVHHRGTDKITEAPLVPYVRTFETLHKKIGELSSEKQARLRIFIATDDSEFLRLAKEKYGDKVIFNDFIRSTSDKPLHYSQNLYSSNYQKCKEAVLDCFLLSRCDFLIYPSSSSFSLLSSKLNANLQSIGIAAN